VRWWYRVAAAPVLADHLALTRRLLSASIAGLIAIGQTVEVTLR
jgi:hypothetical protein